ncbi:MAG: response regulator [Pirellulales bacterium]
MPNSEPHILVVDDERDICENLRDILEDFGYRVDIASTGDAALRLLETESYDVALLDLKMPGIDGVELCRRIRQRRSSTVGMILTAYASQQAANDAVQAGAWRVVSKPIDTFELMKLIDNALLLPLVLVVDDDLDLCEALRDTFRDQGYRVDIAHSPVEVERRLAESAPQVVLIDLKLADASGLEVLELVRSRTPDASTIMITAHRDEMARSISVAMEQGAVAVCYKPFEPANLLARIRESLPAAGARGPA